MSEEVAEQLIKVYANSNPNYEFHVVDGGHHVHLNEPNKVSSHVVSFLEKDFSEESKEKDVKQAAQSKIQEWQNLSFSDCLLNIKPVVKFEKSNYV